MTTIDKIEEFNKRYNFEFLACFTIGDSINIETNFLSYHGKDKNILKIKELLKFFVDNKIMIENHKIVLIWLIKAFKFEEYKNILINRIIRANKDYVDYSIVNVIDGVAYEITNVEDTEES